MGASQDDVFERLNAVIEEWNSEVAHSHVHLAAQIAAAREHLGRLLSDTEGATASPASPLEAEVARLTEQLSARDALIAGLEARLEQEQTRADALESELADMRGAQEQLAEARRACEEARQLIETLRAQQETARGPDAAARSTPGALDKVAVFDEHGHKKRMGEILVEACVITQDQLEEILDEQATKPQCRFGSLVVERGYSNEEVIARILAAQLRLPFVDLKEEEIDPNVPRLVNPHLAELHQCVPLRKEGGRLVLAMSNPVDLIAIEDMELASNCQVDPVVATPKGIQFTIARYCYRPPGS